MTIERVTENGSVTLALGGELTAITAEQLNAAIETAVGETGNLTLDFKDLEYVASAGLRVLLKAQKALDAKGGKLIIRNVCEEVMNVFEITGFDNMLTIE
jgi:anti-sigma B factor antagonist